MSRACLILIIATGLVFVGPVQADARAGMEAYERGEYGVALEEWLPLAEQGVAEAQFNVGLLYDHGRGVEQDRARALTWYLEAAEQDYARAQYRAAEMYESGEGVKKDLSQAHRWFKIAGRTKYADARKRKKKVAKRMTSKEIALAEMYARNWIQERKQSR